MVPNYPDIRHMNDTRGNLHSTTIMWFEDNKYVIISKYKPAKTVRGVGYRRYREDQRSCGSSNYWKRLMRVIRIIFFPNLWKCFKIEPRNCKVLVLRSVILGGWFDTARSIPFPRRNYAAHNGCPNVLHTEAQDDTKRKHHPLRGVGVIFVRRFYLCRRMME